MRYTYFEKKKREKEKKRLASFRKTIRKRKAAQNKRKRELKRLARLRAETAKRRKERLKKKEREKAKLLRKKEKEKQKKLLAKKKRPIGRPKKLGRKKKRRPKKMPQKRGPQPLPPFKYKIISCSNRLQTGIIGKYRFLDKAYEKFNELKENSGKDVVFPSTFSTTDDDAKAAIYEYVLLSSGETTNKTYFRDEYGKIRETTTSKSGWVVIDKFQYQKEETFWVFGFDKFYDRKTFEWIYNNIVIANLPTKYDFHRIILYRNKIVVKDDDNNIDLVLCKCEQDAILMYNMLIDYVKRDKIRQVLFYGDYDCVGERKRRLEDELVELTQWTRKKVQMRNTSYYITKK